MTFSGFWKAKIAIRIILFRVQVDDQLLLDVLGDISPLGEVEESAGERVSVPLEPRVLGCVVDSEGIGDNLEGLALLADANHLTWLNAERRNVYDATVNYDVLMANELASSCASWSDAEAIDYVVEAGLEDSEENLTGDALRTLCVCVSDTELALEDAVGVFCLLLFLELLTVLRELAATALAMLAWRVIAMLEILVWTIDSLTKLTGDLGSWACVPCHFLFFDLSILILNDEYGSR